MLYTVTETVPSFKEEPLNPSRVDEGDNITLRWTYNIDGTFRDSIFSLSTGETIALKDGSGLAVAPAFSDRVQVFISDSEATLTLLRVNRSDDKEYRYRVLNTAFQAVASVVSVFVQCKYKITYKSIFFVFCAFRVMMYYPPAYIDYTSYTA